MVMEQIDRNKKYQQSNEDQGIVAVKVFIPQTKREKLLALAKKWRDEIKK